MTDKIEEKLLKEIESIKKKFKGKWSKIKNQERKTRLKYLCLPILKAKLQQHRQTKKWIEELIKGLQANDGGMSDIDFRWLLKQLPGEKR